MIKAHQAPLRFANCRFTAGIYPIRSPVCVLRNCEFLAAGGVGGQPGPGGRVVLDNCLWHWKSYPLVIPYDDESLHDMSFEIKRSTFVSGYTPLWLELRSPLPVPADGPQASCPLRLEVSDSIFDAPTVLGFDQKPDFLKKAVLLSPAEAEAALLGLLQWSGERNLFATNSAAVRWFADGKPESSHGPKNLEEWKQFWGTAETDSLEGTLRFLGGNLSARSGAGLNQLTPDDFRLRPDSAGYRAGNDGKDLGADVDLVGPGEAYERWKKTPDYQQWLKDTGQLKDGAAVAKPESGAFVLLGGKGVAEQKIDTLAEAVLRASDGDTIEIRGNGPFVSDGVTLGHSLVIRAGKGYAPSIRLSQASAEQNIPLIDTSASLVLEGLEMQRVGAATGQSAKRYPNLLRAWGDGEALQLVNCRLLLSTQGGNGGYLILSRFPVCALRNCQIITGVNRTIDWYSPVGGRATVEKLRGRGRGLDESEFQRRRRR